MRCDIHRMRIVVDLVALACAVACGVSLAPPADGAGFSLPAGLAELDVPLTVSDSAGTGRRADICSTGVPLPMGLLKEAEGVAVFDERGSAVPAQFRVLERWRDFGQDGSVKWLLVTFLADVPAGGRTVYHLRAGANPAPPRPVRIEQRADAYVMGGQVIRKDLSGPFRLVLTDPQGRQLTAAELPVTWSVWESGPVRACLRAESPTVPEKFGFIAWIYAYSGQDRWDLTVVLKNTPRKWRGPFFFKDFSVVWEPAELAGAKQFLLGGEAGKAVAGTLAGAGAYLYQASNGTDKWDAVPGVAAAQPEFRGYRAAEEDRQLGAGDSALGWAALNGGGRGALACTRYFRPQYAKAVEVQPGRILVRLWPGQWTSNGGLHWLDDMTRRAFDLSFRLAPGPVTATAGDAAAKALDSFLVAAAPADWYRAILELPQDVGMWSYTPQALADSWARAQADGWVVFPRGRTNIFRFYYSGGSLSGYALTGLAPAAWYLFAFSRLSCGMVPMWVDDYQYPRDATTLIHTQYCYPLRDPYPMKGYRPGSGHHGWMPWNYSHFFCGELFDNWRLLGDPLALEAIRSLGAYCQAYVDYREGPEYRQNVRGVDPSGATWEGGGNPDAGGGCRGEGCALQNLCQAYRITGEPALLASLRRLAAVSWRQVDKRRGTVCNATTGLSQDPSMMGQMMDGLLSCYQITHDQTTADQICGMLDWIIAEGTADPIDGLIYNHLYHPPLQDAQLHAETRKAWAFRPANLNAYRFQIDPFLYAFVYGQTGDSYYRQEWDRLDGGRKAARLHEFAGFLCALHYHSTARLEEIFADPGKGRPPGPVGDLKAAALGGGRVRLTWTAPTGGATRYQLKWAAKPIVPRLLFDPARRTFQFDPHQHANWWAAHNVEGTPTPAAAGAAQSMTVDGVPVGRRFFAVRSFDAASNRSEISNLAEVTVEGDPARPVITSDWAVRVAVGQPFRYAITAENDPTGFAAARLPAGLSLDTRTGVISGTPTAAMAGRAPRVELAATNAIGTGRLLLTIIVLQPAAITAQPEPQTVAEGQPATFRVEATGSSLPNSFLWCRWLRNGKRIADSVRPPGEAQRWTYTTPPTTLEDDGAKFTAMVGNELGKVTSVEAVLTVRPAAAKAP